MVLSKVFKWPKVGTCPSKVNFELFVLLSIVLNKRLAGIAKDRRTKFRAELCNAKKNLCRWICCDRGGKFPKLDMAGSKLIVDRFL
jgi:hypothetical protein